MMNDYEEDLDEDFQAENETADHAGVYGANESTSQWSAGSGITSKVPPLYDGSTSWFKYEELIDDWIDITVLDAVKQGPALKNRLVGEADLYKGLLDRTLLKGEDGAKYFKDTLRPHFVKGAQSVFLWRCYQFLRSKRGAVEMVKWIGKFSLLLKRLRESWMDMQPFHTMTPE